MRKDILLILEKVLPEDEHISEIGQDEDLRSCGLDSVGMVSLIVKLEEYYDMEINVEDLVLENYCTINKIEKLLTRYGVCK